MLYQPNSLTRKFLDWNDQESMEGSEVDWYENDMMVEDDVRGQYWGIPSIYS